MKKLIKLFTCVFIVLFCVTSCNKNKITVLEFDNSEPLALAPDVRWALVIAPYAAYYEKTDWNSEVKGYSRRGQILQVLSRAEDKDDNEWYRFETGWLPSSTITVYSNRLKAQRAAEELKEKE
jgi:hypothetical protein